MRHVYLLASCFVLMLFDYPFLGFISFRDYVYSLVLTDIYKLDNFPCGVCVIFGVILAFVSGC